MCMLSARYPLGLPIDSRASIMNFPLHYRIRPLEIRPLRSPSVLLSAGLAHGLESYSSQPPEPQNLSVDVLVVC